MTMWIHGGWEDSDPWNGGGGRDEVTMAVTRGNQQQCGGNCNKDGIDGNGQWQMADDMNGNGSNMIAAMMMPETC